MSSLRLQSNINLRGKLLSNMLLVGGTAQLPGLQTRLVSDVRAQSKWVAPGQPLDLVNVVNLVDKTPAVLPWLGGSLLAQCDAIKDLTITREAYEKYGPQVVHQTFLWEAAQVPRSKLPKSLSDSVRQQGDKGRKGTTRGQGAHQDTSRRELHLLSVDSLLFPWGFPWSGNFVSMSLADQNMPEPAEMQRTSLKSNF